MNKKILKEADKSIKNNYSENKNLDVKLAFYHCCFEEKHHYDNLSWIIGGILLVFVGAILAFILQINGEGTLLKRFFAALFSILLLYLWKGIYRRNRLWAEAANQKIKEIERDNLIKMEGIGIKFAKVWAKGKVDLINKDECGNQLINNEREEIKDDKEEIPKLSMHTYINRFINAIIIFIFIIFILLEFDQIIALFIDIKS